VGRLPLRSALIDHHALRTEHHGVIDPGFRQIDRQDPIALPRRRHVQLAELEVDLRHPGLALFNPAAQLRQVRRLGRWNVVVLELDLVDAVLVRNHLGHVEQLERAVRVVLDVGHLQDVLKIQRHDRDAIERRLLDLGSLRSCPGRRWSRSGGNGGAHEKFATVHRLLLTDNSQPPTPNSQREPFEPSG
jgi:hypothetical protein